MAEYSLWEDRTLVAADALDDEATMMWQQPNLSGARTTKGSLLAATAAAATAMIVSAGGSLVRATYAALAAEAGTLNQIGFVPAQTGTHASLAGDFGASGGQTPNSGYFQKLAAGWVRIADSDSQRSLVAAAASEAARDTAVAAALDATTALDLTKLSLYGEPDDKDAALILDFGPAQYLGKAQAMTGGERVNAMVRTVLSSGPVLASQDLSSFVTFARSTTATRVNSAGLIETVAAGVARIDYHPVTKECLGFLAEGASTNLLLRSAEFDNAAWIKDNVTVTPNAVLAPDGTMTADLITETSSTSGHWIYSNTSLAAGATTYSAFFKANGRDWIRFLVFQSDAASNATWFNVATGQVGAVAAGTTAKVENFGGGWYRCSIMFTAISAASSVYAQLATGDNASSNYAGDGVSGVYAWGAQLEALPFASSYIPTVASQVTRATDTMLITGANFTRFFNGQEGTFVVAYDYAGGGSGLSSSSRTIVQIDSGAVSNRYLMYNGSGNAGHVYMQSGGAVTGSIGGGGPAQPGVPQKLAFGYAVNNYAISVNGGAPAADASGELPIGQNRVVIGSHYGHIKSLKYFPTRLSNAKLQEITA